MIFPKTKTWRLGVWRIFIQRQLRKRLKKDFWIIFVKKRPWLIKFAGIFLILMAVLFLCSAYYFYFYTADLKDKNGQALDLEKLGRPGLEIASYVLAKNGEATGRFFYEIRDPVKYEEIPSRLINGFVAAEDQRFYYHPGIDLLAMGRAGLIWVGHEAGFKYGRRQGASTITQQLARQLYAEELEEFKNREQSVWRKIKEARVAIQIEKRFSKKKILEGFLNRIYFGHGINGVAEASRFYFGKDLRKNQLTPREIAILVSLNKSPANYCPIFHEPSKPAINLETAQKEKEAAEKQHRGILAGEMTRIALARDRYNWVLGRMRDDEYITETEYSSSLFEMNDLLEPRVLRITYLKNPYFGYVNRFVKELMLMTGYQDEDLTHYGGLRIKTSIDPTIQKIAVEELNAQLAELNKEKQEKEEKLEGAFVIIENKTGQIAALGGGHDFSETQFNRALALRSPGSAFKPFAYAAAFEFFGKTFDDKICNCPFRMHGSTRGKPWAPKNFKEENPVPLGYIPLSTGLIRSVNLATLNLARSTGIDLVIKTAHDMGVWGEQRILRDNEGRIWFRAPGSEEQASSKGLESFLPTAIGASDVSLLELTGAFSVFARNGIYIKPSVVLEVKDWKGELLYRAGKPEEKRVLSESTSQKITILLRAVTKIGTAKISMKDIEQQVAVKTGTSNGPFDLSMIGWTPEFTVGIRFGYDTPKEIEIPDYMKKASGNPRMQVSGGWVAGPVFRRIIDRIYKQRLRVEFPAEIENGLQELLAKYK